MTMKRVLMASAAISALALSSGVYAAEETRIEINGTWEGGLMIGDLGSDTSTDASGRTTSEPGAGYRSGNFFQESELSFEAYADDLAGDWSASVHIELEGESTDPDGSGDSEQIDETFVRFSSDTFGTIEVGNRNFAGHRMVPLAPSAGFQPFGGAGSRVEKGLSDETIWAPAVGDQGTSLSDGPRSGGAANTLTLEQVGAPTIINGAGTGDSTKINYITPRIFGFQLGLGYAPDACETGLDGVPVFDCQGSRGLQSQADAAFAEAGLGDAWHIAANQAIPLDMIGVADEGLIVIGASYSRSQSEIATFTYGANAFDAGYFVDDGLTEWNVGALLRYQGFNFAAAYKNLDTGDYSPEVDSYGAGFTQQLGKWQFGANVSYAESDRPTRDEVVAGLQNHSGPIVTLNSDVDSGLSGFGLLNGAGLATIAGATNGACGAGINCLNGIGYGGTDKLTMWEVAANYEMGPGIKLIGALRHYDAEHGADSALGEFDGFIFEAGTKIEF